MKKVEVTIRPRDLDQVKEQLGEAGVRGVIASEASCIGTSTHARRVYRGTTYAVDADPCVRLAVVVTDEQLDRVIDILRPAAEHGPALEGAMVVMGIEQALRGAARTSSVAKAPQRVSEKQGTSTLGALRSADVHGH